MVNIVRKVTTELLVQFDPGEVLTVAGLRLFVDALDRHDVIKDNATVQVISTDKVVQRLVVRSAETVVSVPDEPTAPPSPLQRPPTVPGYLMTDLRRT